MQTASVRTSGPGSGGAPWPRRFDVAAGVFAVALVVHAVDHFRRGMDVLTPWVMWAGNLQMVIAVITLVLVVRRHRWAVPFAIGIGLASAVGFVAVHLLPDWGPLSDPFVGADTAPGVNGFSWFAALFEIAADAAFGLVALGVWRSGSRTGGA
jgi:hypothetical protein